MIVPVERLTFTFPSGWVVLKFDDSAFYREQFSKMWQGIKSVDLVAVSTEETVYLIEVKDYRVIRDAGPSELPHVVAKKVFDTLAAQIPCRLNANDDFERQIAKRVCGARALVVVLHLEQPTKKVGIFTPYDRANLQQKLRQLLRPIHARPWVVQKNSMSTAAWNVA